MPCDDVLMALQLLSSIPTEVLQSYREEATFKELQKSIGNHIEHGTPRGRSSSHHLEGSTSSSSLPATNTVSLDPRLPNATDISSRIVNFQSSTPSIGLTPTPHSTLSPTPPSTPPSTPRCVLPSSKPLESELSPSSTVCLIQALDKDAPVIEEYLSRTEITATEDSLNRTTEDPRVVDLQLAGCRSSLTAKFRKCLSERSLATEYIQWESQRYGSSRVKELAENLSSSQERSSGHIKEYLEGNKYRFQDQRVTRNGMEHGIKLLVFERLLETRGISAILSFRHHRFRAIKYDDLAILTKLVNDSPWITTLARSKAAWLDGCQNLYDGM